MVQWWYTLCISTEAAKKEVGVEQAYDTGELCEFRLSTSWSQGNILRKELAGFPKITDLLIQSSLWNRRSKKCSKKD